MRFRYSISTLTLIALAGCATGYPPVDCAGCHLPSAPLAISGNWQIQSGSSASGPSNAAGVLLLGALVSTGTNVTGTLRFSDFAPGNGCGVINQVITVTGTLDLSNNLSLTSAPFNGSVVKVQLLVPALAQGLGAGTIQVTGSTCNFASSGAIGGVLALVTGTYTGTLAPTAGSSASSPATATLTLAQAAAASADGQFAETGTLAVTAAGCTSTTVVSGTTSGVGILVNATPTPTNLSFATVVATQPPIGTAQNLTTQLGIYSSTCNGTGNLPAQYSGTLNKQ